MFVSFGNTNLGTDDEDWTYLVNHWRWRTHVCALCFMMTMKLINLEGSVLDSVFDLFPLLFCTNVTNACSFFFSKNSSLLKTICYPSLLVIARDKQVNIWIIRLFCSLMKQFSKAGVFYIQTLRHSALSHVALGDALLSSSLLLQRSFSFPVSKGVASKGQVFHPTNTRSFM